MPKAFTVKYVCVLACVLALATPLLAQKLKVGEVRGYRSETPHPYPQGNASRPAVWEEHVTSAGATFLRVHFVGLHLADGDYLTVSSPDGAQSWTYAGRGPHGNGDVWAFAIDGDEAIVRIHGGTRAGHGYQIDAVGHGTVEINARGGPFAPTPEVVCGTDGREHIACYIGNDPEGQKIDANQRAVARLQWVSGAFLFACTGSLVRGNGIDNMLMTNNHCINTQGETSALQATFNFQKSACNGAGDEPTTDYAGGTFLKANSGLDYSLLTLQGSPEATWGELVPTTQQPAVGDTIWFIQHGGGNEKKIGYWEDSAQTVRCKVDSIDVTVSSAKRNTQTTYGCDSEGGSSGSPITRTTDGKIVALHHFGGVSGSPCLNSGTEMVSICANATTGSKKNPTPLLSCDSN
ncbi:MAG: trypsin-like serine peptidase [Terriglobales bacterium]